MTTRLQPSPHLLSRLDAAEAVGEHADVVQLDARALVAQGACLAYVP